MKRCMFYHLHRENRYTNEGENRNNMGEIQEKQNNYQRENGGSIEGSSHREKRNSGDSMRNSNSNRGNPWNCLKGVSR